MAEEKIYSAPEIFTGEAWLHDHAVVTKDKIITELVPLTAIEKGKTISHFKDALIAPGFIDLQLYGAAGKLFSVFPEPSTLSLIQLNGLKGGTVLSLPTVATNTIDVVHRCIDAARAYLDSGGEGIAGLHLEGPWINPLRRGAHIETCIHSPSLKEVNELVKYGRGVIKMITLAPEVCDPAIIELLLANDIRVSAGHSNATYEQSIASFKTGVNTVTHLYNAMSPFQHRAPGLPGAVFESENVMASIIPDGYHVDFAAIRIAKNIMKERLYAITDAVTETSVGLYQHTRDGDKFEANNILSGSALTMITACRNLVKYCNIDPGEALRMCSFYPARLMAIKGYGSIKAGDYAKMVVMDNDLNLTNTII